MKTLKEIKEILIRELGHVYCNNCEDNDIEDSSACEDCHRKYMGWRISGNLAEKIAKEITK